SVCEAKVFEQLYQKYSKILYSFIYYKCGDKAQAEDLVQDTFVKMWQHCEKVVFEKAKSFLYTVANNQFLNQVAHKKVVLKHRVHLKSRNDNESPEFILEEKEFMKKLQNAISELTEAQREVFLLNRIDKKKYREISEMLGISEKAIEKRMHGALLKLREKLKTSVRF
ncbi:MAG: RNA polymerase sigma factor, partial [Flavicella sp.]